MKEDGISEFIDEQVNRFKFFNNRPRTLEQLYYRTVFEKHFSGQSHTIPFFWMPRFVNATDASARTLDIYNQTISSKSSRSISCSRANDLLSSSVIMYTLVYYSV